MGEKNKEGLGDFSHESMQDNETIIEYLEALAQGFRDKKLSLRSNGSEIVLEPNKLVSFSLTARRKEKKSEIAFKVSWRHQKEAQITSQPLTISHDEAPPIEEFEEEEPMGAGTQREVAV